MNTPTSNQLPDSNLEDDEDSISLLEIATTIGEEKKWITMITGVVAILTAIVSLLMTPIFVAKTTFIVPNPSAGASAAQALANLGGLMGGGGGAAALLSGGKSPDEMYMEFLKAKSMTDSLITQFDLQKRYEAKSLEGAQKALKARTTITSNKKAGLISVSVEDEDPQFAAELANAYVSNLKKLLESFAGSESQMRKAFYEKELIRVKKDLQGITDYRDMKVRESVLAVIMNQYEVAILDSARESFIQISEKATPPEKRAKPKRTIMVLIAIAAGLFLSILFVVVRRSIQNMHNDPEKESAWLTLKQAWSLRKSRL
jgi:tyrosine-protein kinase Etk/Wzc